MSIPRSLHLLNVRATMIAAVFAASFAGGLVLDASTAYAQSGIPPNLTKLRPIKGIAYDPKPSDFPQNAYFDSDFFNSDFISIWGDDGQPGTRRDLETFADIGLNFLHIYNWNAQRQNHGVFLDSAEANGLKVMIPINNFTAETIVGVPPGCSTCPPGYQAAFNLVKGIFNQVYTGTKPHPAAAMWSIYNEYDLIRVNPVDVVFVVQAILTLEDAAGIPLADRLPITVPVSNAIWDRDHRQALSREQQQAFERATLQWLETNPGKNVGTPPPDGLPGAVLAILAISNALSDSQTRTSYKSKFDTDPVAVSKVPADFWKTRFIASLNPFSLGATLKKYLVDPAQFQSAFPGTTAWNTLPPLFFSELGRSQVDDGGNLQLQAANVLSQLQETNALAVSGATPQGYFLGSCFFQHTYVDTSKFQGFDTTGQFAARTQPATAPFPASGKPYRVDVLTPLPVWASVKQGYATTAKEEPPAAAGRSTDPVVDAPQEFLWRERR